MAKEYNAVCSICGQRYHVCNTCKSMKTQKSWRTVTDTAECYKIYMTVYGYGNGTIPKEKARNILNGCALPKTFQPHIRTIVNEIRNPDGNT